jgi:hypothetical protein
MTCLWKILINYLQITALIVAFFPTFPGVVKYPLFVVKKVVEVPGTVLGFD